MTCKSNPQTIGSRKNATATSNINVKRLTIKPTRTISVIFNLPVPKMIAFGGVATGIMNAQFVAIAAGTMSANG